MSAAGGPEGTAPAGDDARHPDLIDRHEARWRWVEGDVYRTEATGGGWRRSEGWWVRRMLAPVVEVPAAPSRPGRPDPGEDEAAAIIHELTTVTNAIDATAHNLSRDDHEGCAMALDGPVQALREVRNRLRALALSSASTEGADTGADRQCMTCGHARSDHHKLRCEHPACDYCNGWAAPILSPGSGTVPASEGEGQ